MVKYKTQEYKNALSLCHTMARGSFKNKSNFRNNNNNSKCPHKKHKNNLSNSKFNRQSSNKRKQNAIKHNPDDVIDTKRQKIDLPAPTPIVSETDSEDEVENPLSQLLNTFNVNALTNKHMAIDSDASESTAEEENNDLDASNDDDDDEEEEETIITDKDTATDQSSGSEENSTNDDDKEHIISDDENTEEPHLEPNDPFANHLSYDLSDTLLDSLQNTTHKRTVHNVEWSELGKLQISIPSCEPTKSKNINFTIAEEKPFAPVGLIPEKINSMHVQFAELNIKSQIHDHIRPANTELDQNEPSAFTSLQSELFSVINNYQDLYFSERTLENGEEIRFIYCLHAINHILKTRTKVLHHNARMAKKNNDIPEEFRDQGLVRPKVLIVVPFRDSALKIVKLLIDILVPAEKGQVINKLRFMDDFSGNELLMPKKNPKPEDYELTFIGNTDDTFKIGIQVTKKSLKLYADFYSSDIIIASPLGLRLTIGAEGEKERDYDFLASIELLVFDQTELFLMQNWDHVLHLLNHMHMQPKDSHGTDFGRVRTWSLNGWSKYYRQTLIFSSLVLPEINSVFNKKCRNFAGAVKQINAIQNGSIVNVHVQVPQVYRRFDVANVAEALDKRFDFFVTKVLPQYKDNSIMKQCLLYVPNYFDYVRLRNYFKREDISFVQICEYSKDAKIARARDIFFHGDAQFLLYSERFHYFRRIRMKGIRHIIFYQPPTFPHFYSEMCNFMQEANQNKKCGSSSNMTVTVIYSKYDSHQMSGIVGTDRLTRMATSTKSFHMFTSSDNK